MATLILETGMRPGVFHLTKEDVDLDLDFLQVRAGKTDFPRRTIPLTLRARQVLAIRMAAAKSNWLFPAPWNLNAPLGSVRKAHLAAAGKAGINRPFRLYDLRHTALTRMAMAGIDLPTLRELAGHANIQMTTRYVQSNPEHKRNAIAKFKAQACRLTA